MRIIDWQMCDQYSLESSKARFAVRQIIFPSQLNQSHQMQWKPLAGSYYITSVKNESIPDHGKTRVKILAEILPV